MDNAPRHRDPKAKIDLTAADAEIAEKIPSLELASSVAIGDSTAESLQLSYRLAHLTVSALSVFSAVSNVEILQSISRFLSSLSPAHPILPIQSAKSADST
jgi:hypothetical protein